MKLIHKDFDFVFHFEENVRSLLVVENPVIFLKLISEMTGNDSEEHSRIVLSGDDTVLKIKDKLICIIDPLSITLNDRKLLNKLGDMLLKEILSSELLIKGNQIVSDIENYVFQIIQCMDWNLSYSEKIDVQSLLKIAEVRFDDVQETLVEKILDYVKISSELLDIKCFVFVNMLSYLTEYEVEKFYEYVCYQKICVLLLESTVPDTVKKFSETVIIDKDACEIVLNV